VKEKTSSTKDGVEKDPMFGCRKGEREGESRLGVDRAWYGTEWA